MVIQILTLHERFEIESSLNKGVSFINIARKLGKDPTTISKEVRKHRIGDHQWTFQTNDCIFRQRCHITSLCPECNSLKPCSKCKKDDCRKFCPEYQSDQCPNTRKAPYACNDCHETYRCPKPRFFYRANLANNNYVSILRESREGINLSREQLLKIDYLISPLLKQGQSIAHIYATHKSEFPCSLRSLYTYIDMGLLSVRNIDLPKKVKYKPRRKKKEAKPINYEYRKNRSYKDFQTYIQEYPESNIVEMDTVHGSNKKGNVMLTMLFRNCNLMLIILLNECTQKAVKSAFDNLEKALGTDTFNKVFPVILTDNGSEFKGAIELETSCILGTRTKIFYCDPLASWQKAKLEKTMSISEK